MHTSSAVHIRIVFGQLRTFWNQLAWPDAETAYVFVSRILDDICKGKCLSQYMEWIQSNTEAAEAVWNWVRNLHFCL